MYLSEQNILTIKDISFEMLYYIGRYIFKNKQTPILLYHSIDDSGSIISVYFSEFKKQMKFLKDNGFRSLSLDEYITYLKEKKTVPSKSFVLTFDDGYNNFLSKVFPLLTQYGFTATIFLTTAFIGSLCGWIKKSSIPKIKMLEWKDIIQLKNAGISFGAHSVNHPFLTKLTDEEITDEILMSRELIEQKIGDNITTFCYPYGDYDNRVLNIVKKNGFEAACSVDWGVKNSLKSLFALKRLTIGPVTTLSYFKFIFSGFYDLNLIRKRLFKIKK